MSQIETVTGPIDLAKMGLIFTHEHLRARSETTVDQFPDLYDDEADLKIATAQVRDAMKRGMKTICDPTVPGLGRDVKFSRAVSERTGLIVVVASGMYSFDDYVAHFPLYFQRRTPDELADSFVREIRVGIQGTSIKAGFLKCVTREKVTPGVDKVIRAVARAHRKTGAPILTHSEPLKATGLMQQDIFEQEGVNLDRVAIGHCGDTSDMDYLLRIAERGSFMGFDRFGYEVRPPTVEQRVEIINELCKRGHSGKILLSQDHCCVYEARTAKDYAQLSQLPSLSFVVDEIIPRLKKLGAPIDEITHNSAEWLKGTAPY